MPARALPWRVQMDLAVLNRRLSRRDAELTELEAVNKGLATLLRHSDAALRSANDHIEALQRQSQTAVVRIQQLQQELMVRAYACVYVRRSSRQSVSGGL